MKNAGPEQTAFDKIRTEVEKIISLPFSISAQETRLIRIPVCYDPELAPDLLSFCAEKRIDREELIQIHTSREYKIYMMGFLPGFAYMGEVDERIVAPRKQQPVNVTAGCVGIAGKQTGIYPLDSPGGWQIIGKTPWKLFDTEREEPVLLRAGDRVKFYEISKEDYKT